MSKIKLVIEIPQEVHEHAKNTSEDRTDEYSTMRAIANGTPLDDVLDKIRAEIERLHYHPKLDFIKNDEVVDMALDVIDKYREGEES